MSTIAIALISLAKTEGSRAARRTTHAAVGACSSLINAIGGVFGSHSKSMLQLQLSMCQCDRPAYVAY
jgi:hypothetical protein